MLSCPHAPWATFHGLHALILLLLLLHALHSLILISHHSLVLSYCHHAVMCHLSCSHALMLSTNVLTRTEKTTVPASGWLCLMLDMLDDDEVLDVQDAEECMLHLKEEVMVGVSTFCLPSHYCFFATTYKSRDSTTPFSSCCCFALSSICC